MTGAGTKQEPFRITSEQRGHAAHLRVFGEIDMATSPLLEEWLQAAEGEGRTEILVDLEQVTFMDTSGLHVFLRAAERAGRSGRTFAIARASAIVQRVLRITGTSQLLSADAPMFGQDGDRALAVPAMAEGVTVEPRKEAVDSQWSSDS